ncbi:MAG: hypothetical protein KBB91_01960 [Candidatus Pacebacteria bacterium]|jgi:hypothetical protein|nr:hypothetical protein [Candidatus Paceibacterota bacterium]MBP9701014.1 hypothetical protein [Candidatus Paceibacterota bacterium]
MKYSQFTSKERIAKHITLKRIQHRADSIVGLSGFYSIFFLIGWVTHSSWPQYLKYSENPLLDWRLYLFPFAVTITFLIGGLLILLLFVGTSGNREQPIIPYSYDEGD